MIGLGREPVKAGSHSGRVIKFLFLLEEKHSDNSQPINPRSGVVLPNHG